MRKRVGVILAILLVLFCVSLGLANSKDKDGQRQAGALIIIDALMQFGKLERSAVQFPHGLHTAAMPEADCLSCHEEKKGESAGISFQFKRQESLGEEALQDLYHNECLSCHAEREVAKKPTGPQVCNACHINDLEEPPTPDEVQFGDFLHDSHAENASLECNSCHHAYDPIEKKAIYVEGEEESCANCHQETVPASVPEGMPASSLKTAFHDQCLSCHLETQKKQQMQNFEVTTGPLLCSQCHTPDLDENATPVIVKSDLKHNQPDAVVIGAKSFADTMTALVSFNFITGPLLWLSFAIFFIGCITHVIIYFRGLDTSLDRVSYKVNTGVGVKGALRSVLLWLIPFGTHGWRANPLYTCLFYLFHVGALAAPIFLSAHSIIFKERWGLSIPAMPDAVADLLTVGVIIAALGIFIRRMVLPEVRILTSRKDIGVLLISVAPFVTAFIAYHQIGDGTFWTLVHILTGELLLVAVPFTKLSHIVLFFCSRIQIGMDFGIKRGGMKSPGFPW